MHNNTRGATRLLCLHGWLDNRASFLPIMPLLQGVECVAVDLAGHGESAHRDAGSLYHHVDNVRDVSLIMDALQWNQCHLVGHSMGGAISLMAANAYPERILSLTMIDSLHPLSRKPEDSVSMLRQSMKQYRRWAPAREKVFPSLNAAVDARLAASPFSQSRESARLIMEFATEQTAGGFRLRSDARLNFRSPLMLSPEQVDVFIRSVEQPVLAALATRGITRNREGVNRTLAKFQNIQYHLIEGGHHIHMEKPAEVAELCLDFVGNF